jgi:nitrile hydratase
VLFEGRELWGEAADPTLKVSIEAFEPYLEPVE